MSDRPERSFAALVRLKNKKPFQRVLAREIVKNWMEVARPVGLSFSLRAMADRTRSESTVQLVGVGVYTGSSAQMEVHPKGANDIPVVCDCGVRGTSARQTVRLSRRTLLQRNVAI